MLDKIPRRETMVSRRKFLAVSGSVATVGVAGCVGTASGQTEVSMGELDIDGDSATVNEAPSAIYIDVSGDFAIESNTTPEQAQLTLQCHVGEDSLVDDIASETYFDQSAGEYEISGDLLDHRDVIDSDFAPENGETLVVPVLIRIILSVVIDGSIAEETFVEKEVPLEVSTDGVTATLGGSGSVEIVA